MKKRASKSIGRLIIRIIVIESIILASFSLFIVILILIGITFDLGTKDYESPDEMVQNAAIGRNATMIFSGENWNCGKLINTLTTCNWLSETNPDTKVIVEFPRGRGLSPDGGYWWEVKVLAKQDNILITEIQSVSSPS